MASLSTRTSGWFLQGAPGVPRALWARWVAGLAVAVAIGASWPTAWAADPQPEPELVPPKLLRAATPIYPPAFKDRGIAGAVVVELTVDVLGEPADIKVIESAGPEFDAAALAAAQLLRFSPARRGTREGDPPIAVRIRYRFSFTPDQDDRRGRAAAEGRFGRRDLEKVPAGFCSLRGRIVEKGTGRPVAGLQLLLDDGPADAVTENNGEFAFGPLAPGSHALSVAEGEFKALRQPIVIYAAKTGRADLRVERVHYGLYRATAEAPPPAGEMARRELSAEEIQRVPGVYGDALKVVQNLPGVARPSPFGGEVVVRGSAPSDSLAAMEGVRLPLAYHFGGVYSVFNTDLLEGIDFLPGGLPVLWGRQVGGVLNARLRLPAVEEPLAGYVEVNAFHAGAFLKGSLGPNTRFVVAARRSWIDALLNAVVPEGTLPFTAAPKYWDWQAKVDYFLSPRSTLTGLALGSQDQLALVNEAPAGTDTRVLGGIKYQTGFNGLIGILRHEAPSWTSKTTAGAVWVKSETSIGSFLHFDADALDLTLRHQMHWGKGPVQVRGGLDLMHTPFWANVFAPSGRLSEEGGAQASETPPSTFNFNGSFWFAGPAAWWDVVLKPVPELEIVPGLRLDVYRGVDSDETLLPRLAVRWQQSRDLVFKAASGMYSQRPQPQEVLTFGGLGNPNLLSARGIDIALGTEWRPGPADSIDLQVFYKSLWNLVRQTPGLFPSPPYENAGLGRVYGAELLARHKLSQRWFGWIAYTLLWAERKDDAAQAWRPFDWDQRHILTAVGSVQLPNHWEVSARFRLVSGNPTTAVVSASYDEKSDDYQAIQGTYNGERLPAFHQLDLRIDKRWVLNRWMFNLYLDVQNAYNRTNPEGVVYNYDYSAQTLQGGLPIIPSLGLRVDF